MTIGIISILIVVALFALLTVGVAFALAALGQSLCCSAYKVRPDSLFLVSSRTFELVTTTSVSIPCSC
jgi:hypothetical protein